MKYKIGILAIIMSMIIFLNNANCSAVTWKYKKLPKFKITHPCEVDFFGNKSFERDLGCFYCSKNCQFLAIYGTGSVKTNKRIHYKLYRKKAGTKKYKRIKYKMIGRDYYESYGDDVCDIIADKTAKLGKTYRYKVKAYIKKGKKKIYSPMSKSYKTKALNDHGVYKVYSVTPANPSTDTAIIKIKSDKGNSKTFFNSPWVYYGETEKYDCKIIAYSYDLKKWVNGSKLWLKPNKTVYIKLQFVYDGEPKSINYSGENGKSSYFEIDEEKVDYPKSHYKDEITGIECYFDLVTHKGKVEIDAQDDF